MKAQSPILVGLLLVLVALAGCIGGSGEPQDTTDAGEETNDTPDDIDEVRNQTGESVIEIKENTQFDPSSTIHPHDYWLGRDQVTIIERTVEINWNERIRNDPETLTNPSFYVDVEPKTEGGQVVPNFVFPGTGEIEMELTWQGGNGVMRLCFTHQAARGNLCSQGFGQTFSSSEGQASWTIDRNFSNGNVLNEENWDPPHSLKSNWRWQVWPCAASFLNQCPADTTVDQFTLTVTVHRGPNDLPIDPPHFAFYPEDEDRILIFRNRDPQSSGLVQANWFGQAHMQATDRARPYWVINGFVMQTDSNLELGPSEGVIGWETDHLEVTFQADSSNGVPLQLKYRSAAHAWSAPWENIGDPCSSECTFTLPVTAVQTDSPYAYQTQWEYAIFPAETPSPPLTQYEVSLEVWGVKQANA